MRMFAIALAVCITASAQGPIAVTNASSGRVTPGVAPGSFATAYGDFRGVTATSASTVPFPTTLGGVSVTLGTTSAPVQFAGPTQVNFIVPSGTPPSLQDIVITTPSGRFTGRVRVVPSAPGLAMANTAIPPAGAILNESGSVNTESSPARRGEVIQLFGTGPGAVTGSVPDGAAAPSSPLSTTVSAPQVFIGGVPASIQFSGLAPGLVGTWQMNVFVPEQPFLSGRVPLVAYVDGVDSNEVTVFVAP